MVYPREVLNRLKWADGESLDDAVVFYVHRGAPMDTASVRGSEIVSLERGFFETGEVSIPYHRIRRIEYRGRTIFERHPARS